MQQAMLTFYPISKNLIILSKQYYQSINNNKHLDFTENHSLPGEDKFYYNILKVNWYPWLWSRIPRRTTNNTTGWELYFDKWDNQVKLTNNFTLDLGLSINKLFKLNNFMLDTIKKNDENLRFSHTKYQTNPDKKLLSIVVRRGDMESCTNKHECKKYVDIEKYINEIKKYKSNEYDIFIASEDSNIFNILVSRLSDYNINQYKHTVDKWNNEQYTDIEGFCSHNNEYIEPIITSALTDFNMLQRSNVIIAPIFDSAFSYAAFLLACGYNKKIIEYVDIVTYRRDIDNIHLI
jgi:hypothetical protein